MSEVSTGGASGSGAVRRQAGEGPRGLTLHLSAEQLGMAATALVVFLGVGVIGPGIAALRRPKRVSVAERARRAGQDARLRAEVADWRTGKRLRRLGGTLRA